MVDADSSNRDIDLSDEQLEKIDSDLEQTRSTNQVPSKKDKQSSREGSAIARTIEEEGINSILETVGGMYQSNQEKEREHTRRLLRDEMKYNLSILIVLGTLVAIFTFTTQLAPVSALMFIAGLATGFGTNSALSSLSSS
jgi:Fe2+ transport system protein B